MCSFLYNDGGRSAAGFTPTKLGCVTRAIAIATGIPYKTLAEELADRIVHSKKYRWAARHSHSVAGRLPKQIYRPYLEGLGWVWKPLMGIGTGCRVHLTADELPSGTIICRVSNHLVAVKDGVIHDQFNCSRGGNRCVYGYYHRPEIYDNGYDPALGK